MDAAYLPLLPGAIVALWLLVLAAFAGPLYALWREPMFRSPIAILESDDWGAGPASQAPALRRLADILGGARTGRGESPVMTVGVILEVIDRDARRTHGAYAAAALSDPGHAAVLEALVEGERRGRFALQLHGLAHYWPDSLLAAATTDPTVAAWLAEPGLGWTECLPSPLQSRWTEASVLPSRALPEELVTAAARAEVEAWRTLFGTVPMVAVPTTFVWNAAVERAWSAAGIRVLVTPGTCHERRDMSGAPEATRRRVLNGERGEGGMLLLVRDVYFEPALGHEPPRLADDVMARAALGRPALIEMHRFNFCGPRAAPDAFDTLTKALRGLIDRVPDVRFLSTATLAGILEGHDSAWLENSLRRRLGIWSRRARLTQPFARCARATGLILPLRLLAALA